MSDSAPATAAILTLGCKLNIADSEAMARRLREAGWRVVDRPAGAEAAPATRSSVPPAPAHKSRRLGPLARRVAPKATVALTGCLLETASPQTIDALGADLAYRQPAPLALAERIIELRPAEARPHPGPLPE